jgi:hypothetical protein
MTFKQLLVPAALACVLGACAQQPMPSAPPPPMAGQCNAAGAQFALGGTANAALVEEARKRSGALMARVIGPGQAVTMEYSAQRLNLDVNAANSVMNVRCG